MLDNNNQKSAEQQRYVRIDIFWYQSFLNETSVHCRVDSITSLGRLSTAQSVDVQSSLFSPHTRPGLLPSQILSLPFSDIVARNVLHVFPRSMCTAFSGRTEHLSSTSLAFTRTQTTSGKMMGEGSWTQTGFGDIAFSGHFQNFLNASEFGLHLGDLRK